jgi:hypothetical protein
MSHHTTAHERVRNRRGPALAGALVALALAATGCTTASGSSDSPGESGDRAGQEAPQETPTPAVQVASNVKPRGVAVDKTLTLTAQDGSFEKVAVRGGKAKLRGELSADRSTWTATDRLEPGTTYAVRTVAVDDEGLTRRTNERFTTEDLTLDQQTYPSIAPLDGETVGVGMPVIVQFDVAVQDKASIERVVAAAARRLALDQRPRGALAAQAVLAAGHRRHRPRRHQQHPRRQWRLRPAQPHLELPRR